MKSKLAISKTPNILLFLEEVKRQFAANLTEKLMEGISTLLALDYVNRLKSDLSIDKHISSCSQRLQKHLSHRVITDESFANSMMLFCIAITPEKNTTKDNELASHEEVQEAAADVIIQMHLGDLSTEEKMSVKFVLKDLLNGKDAPEITNFLNSNPKLFHCVLVGAIKSKKKQHEIIEFIKLHITRLIIESKSIDKKINTFKNFGTKFSLAGGLMFIASAGLALGGFTLPAFMIPASAVTIKYAPLAGEMLGEVTAGNSKNIQNHKKTFEQVKSAVIELSGKSNAAARILSENHGTSLESIKEKLHQQKLILGHTLYEKKNHVKAIQSEGLQEQTIGRTRIR